MGRNVKKLEPKICVVCGEEFQPKYYNAVCCSPKCSATSYERKKFGWREQQTKKRNIVKETIKEKVVLITDEEQKKIDKAVAEKVKTELQPCFSYIPGTPAFEKAVFETYLNHNLF